MSFRIKYTPFPNYSGGFDLFAVLKVSIARAEKTAPRSKRIEAIIDSGAAQCLFHSSIGTAVGFDVYRGEQQATIGVTGSGKVYLHRITLYVPGGPVEIEAGFCDSLPVAAILGMTGFFDHFRVTFDPTSGGFDLERVFHA